MGLIVRAILCVLLGWFAGLYIGSTFPSAQVADIAKWGIGVFAFLWTVLLGLMSKVSDITDIPALTYEEHLKLDEIVKVKLRKLWAISRMNVLMSALCLIPVLSLSQGKPVSPLLCGLVGLVMGIGVFCVLLYEAWLEELREFRSNLKEKERLAKAIQEATQPLKGPPVLTPKDQDLSGFGRVSNSD
ncbi:hypothetical protein JOS77_30835 [Chromobacterium haemolyticum]|nr:hypothetical protein JOS77_30835 [Chromobacterium haemolyticum]